VVGVGSAVNRSLTATAARAGRGVEVLIGLEESGADAAQRLLAHLDVALATEIEVGGSALRSQAPARLRDLALGAPVLIAVELDPAGGELFVRGDGFGTQFRVSAIEPGSGNTSLAKLFARERVEDLEMRAAAGESTDAEIARIGLDFAVATRLTSWVAVSSEATVDPRVPTRRTRIPQMVPAGLAVEGFGLRGRGRLLSMRSRYSPIREGRETLSAMDDRIGDESRSFAFEDSSDAVAFRRAPLGAGFLRGRRVVANDRELVIEFEVAAGGLDWDPADLVHLVVRRLRTREIESKLDTARSTAPGRIQPGEIVRIVLALVRPIRGRLVAVRIENAGEAMMIKIEA
jgi:hypothetical protein